ncbi:Cu(I)-responsive transcriptional regulator [Alphaproteobacteria bacterium LSUCC0684]
MNISEAAHRSGLTVKTVRYYANIGMIVPARHKATGYRAYADSDIAKLQLVGTARKFDFSVEECRELLALYEDKNRPSREVKQMTLNKIAEIDQKLSELASLKAQLSHLASSCDGDNRSHCPILNAFSKGEKEIS